MAAYRQVYDSRHLQADCQETGSAPEPYARQSGMGYLYLSLFYLANYTGGLFDADIGISLPLGCRLTFLEMTHFPNNVLLELDNDSNKLTCSILNTAL